MAAQRRRRPGRAGDPGDATLSDPTAPAGSAERLLGVDAARAVALAGMFATHTLPLADPDGSASLTGLVAHGRSSALFAVLAGVGIALSTRGLRGPRDHAAAGAGLLVRAVLVGLLGLALVGLDPPVAVILAYYALLFVVAVPLLRLRAGALAAGAAVMVVAGPVLSQVLRAGLPDGPGPQAGLGSLADPGQLLVTLVLTGYYPVLPWTAYLLAGMAVGRLDLRDRRVGGWLLGGGAALAVVAAAGSWWLVGVAGPALDERGVRHYGTTPVEAWWWLVVDAPHSGTPFDLAHTIGTALAVLGLGLLLPRAVAWLPAAVGAVPLTLYTGHVVWLAARPTEG
ncbi:heparan-alpha-glucosaminide N-acetyltransferase domain-containing protein, partial [Pseudonocardia abyssalis]|uniref:heparan-alpha-glucosaminide N-acetyltransferase domain-containing protein n=1 Tax=Pseudonocardia abyssalis TaxID=2792008 RepID=UPI001C49E686